MKKLIPFLALGVLALWATTAYAQIQWHDTDVGTTTLKGSVAQLGAGNYTIIGGGADIWGTADGCHFLYAWGSGQTWDAIVEVTAFTGPDTWSKCELMVRASDPQVGPQGPDAFVAMMATQNTYSGGAAENAVIDQFRTASGGNADWKQAGSNPIPVYPGTWMGIHRNGPVFNIYYYFGTTDPGKDFAVNWLHYFDIDTSGVTPLVGQDNGTKFGPTPFPDIVAVGVAVTAHNDADGTGSIATIANLSATFPAGQAPTAATVFQQIKGVATNVLGGEVSLTFMATNNAVPAIVAPTYQWYKGGSPVANATNSIYTWLLDGSDNNTAYYCKAGCAGYPAVTPVQSDTFTAKVLAGTQYTNGFKLEMFAGVTDRTLVERGDVAPATWVDIAPNGDDPGNYGNNYVSRTSGWFIPPTTDKYTFFMACDDDSDLFLNTTGNSIPGKQMIAQQLGWAGTDQWFSDSSTPAQARSDQWVPDPANPPAGGPPYAAGIQLTANQPYYIEAVHHQGGGGDNICITYQTAAMNLAGGGSPPNTVFANGTNSLLYPTNNNMRYYSIPATSLTWVTTPTNYTTTLGFAGHFYSQATSDGELTPIYQWYKNGTPLGRASPAAANLTTANTVSGDNGAQFQVVVSTAEGELSITSAVVTLNVAAPVLEYGWSLHEYWYQAPQPTRTPFIGSVVTNDVTTIVTTHLNTSPAVAGVDHTIFEPKMEGESLSGSAGDSYTERATTLFYPPANDNYVFFVNSDDDSDLYVSTDSGATNAVLVAQEAGWSASWQWTTANGGAATLKCSSTWTDANGNTPWANGIHMNANTPYYIAIIHNEGGGGDNCEATYMSFNDWVASGGTGPALGAYSAMTGKKIASYTPRAFNMSFTQQPANAAAVVGGLATFTASGATDSTSAIGDLNDPQNEWNNYVVYQWIRNGVPIQGAVSSSYSFGPVSPLDSGDQYACTIRALGYQDNSGNNLWKTSNIVNVVLSGNVVYEPGFSLHEYFALNPGRTVVEANQGGTPTWLMASPAFAVDDQGTEIADNFTDQLLGYFIPPSNGNYVFFCNGDDDTDLFLGTDSSASSRRLIAQETGWGTGALQWGQSANGPAAQTRSDTFVDPATGITLYSNGIPLIAGQKYFMQCVHHQGVGGTYSCITYETTPGAANPPANPPNGTVSAIRGALLGTYVPACTNVTITTQPQSATVNNYASVTFTAGGTTDSTVPIGGEADWRPFFNNFLQFQWYKNNAAIAGATASAYTDSPILPSDNNANIYCTVRALGYANASGIGIWQTSHVATLSVTVTAPQLVYGAQYVNNNYVIFGLAPTNYITLAFSNPMDPVALSQMGSYTLPAGLTLLGVMVNSNDYRSVALAFSGTPPASFNVTVSSSLTGLGGGPALTGPTSIPVLKVPLTDVDIGTPATTGFNDPIVPGMMYVTGTNSYTIACEGSDIWNSVDGFNFAYEQKTGDFDVSVRVKDNKHTSNWAKAGLMVRETLDADSRNWNIVNDPASADGIMAPDGSGYGANAVECNARVDKGAASAGWTGTVLSTVPAYPNAWVRLTRVGNLLSAYFSTNNAANWTLAATNDPAQASTLGAGNLPGTVFVGLCTTAHNNDTTPFPTPLLYLNVVDYADYGPLPAPPQIIKINAPTVSNGKINITWTPAVGRLLGSPALTGALVDWQPVGTGGSASITITGVAQYFKVVNP